MKKNNRNYSHLIRPITLLLDLLIVNVLAYIFFIGVEYRFLLAIFLTTSWVVISWTTNFYEVYRHSKVTKIMSKIFRQFVGFCIVVAALNGLTHRFSEPVDLFNFAFLSVLIISTFKFTIFFSLKYFRRVFGGNYRNVIIVGDTKETKALYNLFQERKDMGYRVIHCFDKDDSLDTIKEFVLVNGIHEIYMCFDYVIESSYQSLLIFADSNLITLKYLPSAKQVLTHNLEVNYYEYIPVVPRRVIPLDKPGNRIVKRVFDILFSGMVIVFILSWLIPVIALLIKLESKGPVFFKQKRTGLKDNEFSCYKFRSMKINNDADKQQATKNDTRITKIGSFIRKTSIDEFPQFFNVFIGDMSIVGPRPHMIVHTKQYSKRVNRFMLRHLVKPGITGMAQTHGYRGEIENDRDIINRFKYDLFYLENWSLLLDLKIVYLTVWNVFKGEEKAY
ncbi:MAG: exopolysaccharide biosynthesis polyprenyl glycosylphosphotransferase [Flavobacteriaceae bacterium]|jgi:putative colanic acid biosynthesis UDP-glucose lipid carrier transferase|nr:exopolysaccharide biosynthesis polyprenyl glycosylphosphotransferase [Flavobacteriaceae bacterium]